ncbi:unnamed protein product [Caenorhabditis bovis]|uniref:ZP domain-containing protein n=1 Tax=Caenorhabditis bovis TaxID=2654633 RepID=A0A8S1E352_9PELO|nr:unnamed protein product [Caenorhabditis bovis]
MLSVTRCTIFLIFLKFAIACNDQNESAVFVVPNGRKLPSSSVACFNVCAQGNCTGILLNGDKCIIIDTSNYFGKLNRDDYVTMTCMKKLPRKIVAFEWNDRILVGQTQRILQTQDKVQCIASCANEKDFPCLSVMYYTTTQDCLLNSASSASASLKMDTDGVSVSYMELNGLKDHENCLDAYRMIGYDEIEIRGEARIFDGSSGFEKCIARCDTCDFVIFNEIYSECFLVEYDPAGQILDYINDEYQVLTNACSNYRKNCNAQNSLYITYSRTNEIMKAKCLEKCTMNESCRFAYSSQNGSDCILSRRKMALPLVTQRICTNIDDLPDGSAILFDEVGGCPTTLEGDQISPKVELYECMELCATHPTRSCESISYRKNTKECFLHNGEVHTVSQNKTCSTFSLNVIAFEMTGKAPPSPFETTKKPGYSKPKFTQKAKTFSATSSGIKKIDEKKLSIEKAFKNQSKALADVKINTQCNIGDITLKIKTSNLQNGEIYVRNAHENCSANIDGNGEATLRVRHNNSACPISQNGNQMEMIVVVTQNVGEATVITIDDQLFKVRCNYSNQKKSLVVSSTMNLRTTTYSNLGLTGRVKVKPMSMELRSKRDIVKAKLVQIGQSLDLVFKSESPSKDYFVKNCVAIDKEGQESIQLIKNGCASINAKEYVLRGEVLYTKTGFSLPFRAFRFKQSESVRIECEIKLCRKCKKPNCNLRNRRNINEMEYDSGTSTENVEKVLAELLVKGSIESS